MRLLKLCCILIATGRNSNC